jgi:hypothetical protein
MDGETIAKAIAANAEATGRSGGRLVLVNKPKANLYKFFTVPPEQNGGVTVEKYTTRFQVTYEKHIAQNGVTTWWRLLAPALPSAKKI